MTLDGKIATASGDSRWISSPVSRKAVHRQLRDRCDAVLTGRSTVIHDDPEFTTRLEHRAGRDPWRIVVDSELRIPETAKIVRHGAEDGKTILVATKRVSQERVETFRSLGCQVIIEEADNDGRVSLPSLLATLGTRGDIVSVIVESGGELAAAVAKQQLADRFLVFIAPKIAGGRQSPGPIGGDGVKFMKNADNLRLHSVRRSGPDVVIDAHWVECD
jgi:diaminohydroxyphosphoribosylaminopyrimidine deaminase/5-amino-6-(5-phosphoribosylamino)uracil reductase